MEYKGFFGAFYKISEWLMKLAYLNLLWLLFTLAGLIIFGFVPSTIAMFAVIRKWLMGKGESATGYFWKTYKKEFLTGNLFNLGLLSTAYFLYYNWVLADNMEGSISELLTISIYFFMVVFVIYCLYFFPIYVHFHLKKRHLLTAPVFIAVSQPLITIILIISILLLLVVFYTLPGLVLFYSVVSYGLITMFFANMIFTRLQVSTKQPGGGKHEHYSVEQR